MAFLIAPIQSSLSPLLRAFSRYDLERDKEGGREGKERRKEGKEGSEKKS